MSKQLKKVALYGIIKPKSNDKKRFDDSKLFKEDFQFAVLLKKIKIYFGKNIKGNNTLLGLEASYINFINGERIEGGYHGAEKEEENIDTKQLILDKNDYIKNFEFNFEDFIDYIKIISSKGNEIEFGTRPEKIKTILNYEGENMIQFFWGDCDKEGINAIGFKYTSRKDFIFGTILPILNLRFKLLKDKEFNNKYQKNYKELLKNDISMIYLYRACLLPDSMFACIIKYC